MTGICRFDSRKQPLAKSKRLPKALSFLEKCVVSGVGSLDVVLPIKVSNEGNCNEAWRTKHARHKLQKFHVRVELQGLIGKVRLPCIVSLTRYAPRLLDGHDGLPFSFKWIVDTIADLLIPGLRPGMADSDPRITWQFYQQKSKAYGLRVTFAF